MTKTGCRTDGMPAMNALDAAVSGRSYHDRANAASGAAKNDMETIQLKMQKAQLLGKTGDHEAVIRRLEAAGLVLSGCPTDADEVDALMRKKNPAGPSTDEFEKASVMERMMGVQTESTATYEKLKTRAQDAIAQQRAESEAARGPGAGRKDRDAPPGSVACETCAAVPEPGAKFMACSRCHTTKYCSRECQKTHWGVHKKYCKTIAAGK